MHTPHTSKLIGASLALVALATVHAGPLGVNVAANGGAGINGIAGSAGASSALRAPVFSGASAAAVHSGPGGAQIVGASAASAGLARAGAAMGASSNGVVFPDVVVDKSDYETIGMRADHANEAASSKTSATVDHERGLSRAVVASDDRVAVQAREATSTSARFVTSENIRAATPQQRSQIIGSVAASMADDAKVMAQAKRRQKTWTDAEQADFMAAAQETTVRAKVVKKDLKAADKASEQDWAQTRAQLATDYAAYAQASDHARAIANASSSASAAGQATASAHTPAAKANASATAESHAATQARL